MLIQLKLFKLLLFQQHSEDLFSVIYYHKNVLKYHNTDVTYYNLSLYYYDVVSFVVE